MEDWKEIDELFGLNLINDSPDINDAVRDLISERQAARDNKNFARSDEIREELKSFGIAVEDTPNGPIWQYI